MPKVSVIIPVYGVEQYIERCARSLFEQTLDDMEFVFVDDCTPDSSIKILEKTLKEYPSRTGQTRIVRMPKNSGLHNVRKEGLKYVTGKYIAHCDSDDWVDRDMYRTMYNYAVDNDFDLVKCQYYISDEISNKSIKLFNDNKNKEQIIKELLSVRGWNCIWDKLAKRDLYIKEELVFPATPMWEDFVISTQLILRSQNFGVLDKELYYYYVNPNSICTNKSHDADLNRCKNAIPNLNIIIQIIRDAYPNNDFNNEILKLKYEAKRKLIPMMTSYKNYCIWSSIYPEIDLLLIKDKVIRGKQYYQYLMVVLRLYPIYKLFCK